ncbi:MAG: HD-GYP domain-containing protein [Cycloclasticus sp.]|nr:HD-GYP domain-containing protein [Cycloclasticus sp.]
MISWLLKLFGKKSLKIKTTKHLSESELTYIRSANLELGMYVAELDRPWLESPFKLQGFNIKTERELGVLKNICYYVYIDRARESKLSLAAKSKAANSSLILGTAPKKKGSFEKEIHNATKNYRATGQLVSDFMQRVKNGGGIDTKLAKEAVASSVNSILQSPDAHLWLTQLKKKDEYTAQHSLNVSMLSIVLGRHIGLSTQELRNLGLCGMMHDMGKMLIPSAILNKPSELNPEELDIMKTHTTLGAELLKSSENMFHGAIETALTHHERIKGQGYPQGLKNSGVSFYSNIVSIVDTYDALTSDKVYKKGMTHLEATQVLYQQAGEQFDRPLVSKFIESLGVFPPGCYVQLSDNQIALVLEVNEESKLRPRVMTIMDRYMNPVKEMVINLDKVLTDSKGRSLRIQGIVSPEAFNIDREKHFQEGVISNGFAMGNS